MSRRGLPVAWRMGVIALVLIVAAIALWNLGGRPWL